MKQIARMSTKNTRALLLTLLLFAAAPAFALNNRSAVSINGLDTNPCTVMAPCRSFVTALNNTASGGEVIALDSAGYGPFVIFQSVSVSGVPGVHAAITATSLDAIFVNVPGGDRVLIRNLVLIGSGGINGINASFAGELHVIGCFIRGFIGNGIQTHGGNVSVDKCVIGVGSGAIAVSVSNSSLTGTAHGTITDSLLQGGGIGIYAGPTTAVVAANTTITGFGDGIHVESTSGTGVLSADLVLEKCIIAYSVNDGLFVIASGGNNVARAYLSQNVFDANRLTAAGTSGGGIIYTFSNNRFVSNGGSLPAMTPIAFQ